MTGFTKSIGPLQGSAMVATTLIGTGIYVVPAMTASISAGSAVFAWTLAILAMLPIAFTFALLGKSHPHAGGVAYLVRLAFGSRLEKQVAWLSLSIIPVGLPAALEISANALAAGLDVQGDAVYLIKLGTLLIAFLLIARGNQVSGSVQLLVSLAIVVLIVTLLANYQGGQVDVSFSPSGVGLTSSMALILWCFVGIEAVTHMAGEFKNPRRDYPISIIVGVVVAGLLYVVAAFLIVSEGVYGDEQTNARSFVLLFEALLGDNGNIWVGVISYLTCFVALVCYLQGFSRMVWNLADIQVLPGAFAQLSKKGQPLRALTLIILIGLLSLLAEAGINIGLSGLILFANAAFAFIYLLAMMAGYRLLKGVSRWVALSSGFICFLFMLSTGWGLLYPLLFMVLANSLSFLANWRAETKVGEQIQLGK